MESNYWNRVLNQRLGRRRAISATFGAAGAAAFLAACGGGDDNGGSGKGPKDSSGLLFNLTDETKEAKRGGVLVGSHPGVILTFDPMKTGINIRGARRGYSQLFRITDGILQNTDGSVEGDFAQSWEISPDKLTITAKVDPGVGLPPVAPVNGRVMDAEDVVFTWERFKKSGQLRSDFVNEVNPGAPILSVTAPDKNTVVVKLKEPDVTVMQGLATDRIGTMYILPKEAGDKFDPDRDAYGSGPFYILPDKSEISYRWKRNPNFKRSKLKDNEPYLDEIYEPVIPDTATGVAQFRTGAIYWYGVPAAEIVSTKRDNQSLTMRSTNPPITGTERIFFGSNPDSVFKDERVRIAYMRTIDRDSFIAAASNTDQFAKEGLPVQTFWEGAFGAGYYSSAYLDPKSKEYGPNAKNFIFDVAEAKKLLEAAGHKTPLEIDQVYAAPGPSSFPAGFYTRSEIFMGMVESSGIFKMKRVLINYQTEWNTERYITSGGKFNGVTWGPDTSPPDGASAAFFQYNSKGGRNMAGPSPDATMEDLTLKVRREFDDKKRADIVHEIDRLNAAKMTNIKIASAGGFALNWPAYRNVGVHQGGTNWMDMRVFIDPSQAPLKKS
ncbi:MAG TPA: ABC transporter substrate-binding protein [Dehalococcoidia bacterium]|nr:ABC transporter substrate-binding protein [Dehalococcoidia bacterium]